MILLYQKQHNSTFLKLRWLSSAPFLAASFGDALTLVTWVVVEVERVSAVALNMLVSTSFPAELPVICRTEQQCQQGLPQGSLYLGLAPLALPKVWDLPTGTMLLR